MTFPNVGKTFSNLLWPFGGHPVECYKTSLGRLDLAIKKSNYSTYRKKSIVFYAISLFTFAGWCPVLGSVLIVVEAVISRFSVVKPNEKSRDGNFFTCFRRWKVLQVAVDERYKLLSGFGKDGSTPGSQAFLASSVEPPWERALTPAKVPYYIK